MSGFSKIAQNKKPISGANIYVHHLTCYGSHGISISVGFSNDSMEQNTLTDVLIEEALIFEAMSGIHIKTHIDAGVGLIRNITYRNIGIIGEDYLVEVKEPQ